MMIKHYRKILGLTQGEMARKIGISEQSYWNKENGRRVFNDREKLIVRDVLKQFFPDITVDDIFFNQPAHTSSSSVKETKNREIDENELIKFSTQALIDEIERRKGNMPVRTKETLRSFRRALGMTMEDMGKELGVNKASVSHWENGRNNPSIEIKMKLMDLARERDMNEWWFKLGEVLD